MWIKEKDASSTVENSLSCTLLLGGIKKSYETSAGEDHEARPGHRATYCTPQQTLAGSHASIQLALTDCWDLWAIDYSFERESSTLLVDGLVMRFRCLEEIRKL